MPPKPNTPSETIQTAPNHPSLVEQLARQLLRCAEDDPTLRNRLLTEAAEVREAVAVPLAEAVDVHAPVTTL